MKMPLISILVLLLSSLLPQRAECQRFEYKHIPGARYRILTVVDEAILVNGNLIHRAEILNRISLEIKEAGEDWGFYKASFQTSTRLIFDSAMQVQPQNSQVFHWARDYESEFQRSRLGLITIDPEYYMPVVRDLPLFPDRELMLLERWSAEGHEVHDFRDNFGIEDPYRIPFTANYQFIGERQWKGEFFPAFSVSYRIDSRPPAAWGRSYPLRITGESDQIVYWNNEHGRAAAQEEAFRLVFQMSDGRTIEFRGRAESELLESEYMDREQLVSEIAEEINRLDIPDVNVRVVDEGITISLENIGFYPDSAVMLPGELDKLERIAEILLRYPQRDILVSGHTALAGTREGRMTLSTERAKTVADFLLERNVRSPDRMVIQGHGAERPIADNNTEEGMRRNRRVEITILEN